MSAHHGLRYGFACAIASASASAIAIASSALGAEAPIHLRAVVDGLERPVSVVNAGDGSGRLFVVQQGGEIRIFDGGRLLAAPFLDLSSIVSCCGEQGLLGLAFHPSYETNGTFYVDYTDLAGDTRIARYHVATDPDVADAGSGMVLLSIDQPFANHNGGQILFGRDGKLWIGTGDGGSAGDPQNNAQNGSSLLGKILRIDVDSAFPYGIPSDNPFLGNAGVRDEIWAIGLRNPWKFTFDRVNGDLFIADVGQGNWEEIDFEPATSLGGRNYGWRKMEGGHCFNPANGCNDGSLTLPVLEYSHAEGCSVTGGYRYRGREMPVHDGTYFFGDYCSGRIWAGTVDPVSGTWTRTEVLDSSLSISSFGEDEKGELYVTDLGGTLYRVFGETFCNVQLSQHTYLPGETVSTKVFEMANLSAATVAVEFKIWLTVPGTRSIPVRRGGADGSIVLPADFSTDAGAVDLFTVSGTVPKGTYALGCRFIDPATGGLLAEDVRPFEVR
jgi:glucose/arabinose dehydrogenase